MQVICANMKTVIGAGYEVSTTIVNVSSRASIHALVQTAVALGDETGVIHAAGVSPSQASPETILKADLYGTALVLEEFGNVITKGGSCVVIASQSGHRLGALRAEENKALATTPADDLLSLSMLQPSQVTDSFHAYQLSKRGNSLRVMAEAIRWGKRGARVKTARYSRLGTGISNTPSPLGIKANSCPACQSRAVRTALGMEIWNLNESFAVFLADITIPRPLGDW